MTDRNFFPDRLGKERKRSSRVLILAILVAVLMLGAIAGLMVQIANNREQLPSETPLRTPARILYTTHSNISIVGNGGFTNASGVVWGSGTASDPYIIADWDIDASTTNGIWIQDTDAHFIVRNCHIQDGSWSNNDGIYLLNCVNGTLEKNNCSGNLHGIVLHSSSCNTLANNTCSSNSNEGIHLNSSNTNILSNNTCSTNSVGIRLDSSNNNTLSRNDCSNCGDGIRLRGRNDNNTLSNNTCSNDQNGIYLYSSNGNVLGNNTCSNNTCGIYLQSSNYNTLRYNYCSIFGDGIQDGMHLFWSSNNMLINNNCSNGFNGIWLEFLSSGNTVSNNNCSSNDQYGMYLYDMASGNTLSNNNCSNNLNGIYLDLASSRNTLNNNNCSSNTGYGICLISPLNRNIIWNNTLIHNNGATDTYDANHVQAYDDGTNNWWNSSDGYGNYWSDWTTPDAAPPFGIVDLPYNISGAAGAKDFYPLTAPQAPIPEFGMMPFVAMVLLAVIVVAGETRRKNKSRP